MTHRWAAGGIATTVVLLSFFLATTAGADEAAIRYVYDDVNRLIGVIDKDGNVAQYVYDAVGNLLRIHRTDAPASGLAITLVSPTRGRTGRAVQIFGKGFGDTPGANTVKFNGTTAAVTEASPNRLLTAVPSGATTGSVTVTVGAATATSPSPFVVGGAIAVTPATSSLFASGALQFEATEDGVPTSAVTWAVNGITGGDATIGTITNAGLYTTPTRVTGITTVTVTATHSDDRASSASGAVTIYPGTAAVGAPLVSIVFAEPKTDTESAPAVSVVLGENLTTVSGATEVSAVVAESLGTVAVATPVSSSVEPVVTGVSPASAARGATSVSLTLTGEGLADATSLVFLARNGSTFVPDPGITATDLTASPDGTQLTATINVSTSALLGEHVVQVTADGGSSTSVGTTDNGFSVTQ